MSFIRQRFFHQRYQIGLLLGLFIIIGHVYFEQLSNLRWLDGIHLNCLAITQWLGFDNQYFANVFFFSLPILCSLGPSLAITEDLRNGFVNHLTQFSLGRYLTTTLGISFFSGAFTGIIPAGIDYWIARWFFPNKTPNLIINYEHPVTALTTYGSKFYYQNPFLNVLISLSIIGITCEIFSLLSVLSGVISRNRYIAMTFPFILVMVINVLSDKFPDFIYSPTSYMFASSSVNLPPFGGLILTYTLLIIGLSEAISYVFKRKITI